MADNVVYTGVTRLYDVQYNIDELKTKMKHYHNIRKEVDELHVKAEEKTSQVISLLDKSLKLIAGLERNTPRMSVVEEQKSRKKPESKPGPKPDKKAVKKKEKKSVKHEKKVVKRKPESQDFVDRIQGLKDSFEKLKQDLELQRDAFLKK